MTQADFLLTLEQDLRLRGVPFAQADLWAFVASAWPLIEDAPDVAGWAREFAEAVGAGVTTSGRE